MDPVEENGRKEWLLFGLGNFLNHFSGRARGVDAEWFFGKEISRGSKGAGAAAHADVTKFAAAALPFQIVVVAKLVEDDGVRPDIGEASLAQIAGQSGQIAARKYFTFVRDKADTCAGEAAFGHGVHVAGVSATMTGVTNRRTAAWLEGNSR